MERFQQFFQLTLLLIAIPWLDSQEAGEVCEVALTNDIYAVSCDRRNLTEVPIFPMLTSPYHLNMSFNLLNSVNNVSLSLENTQLIKILDLSHNLINDVHKEAFNSLRNLIVLNMSHNNLEELPKFCFHKLGRLQFLSLSHNQIVSLSSEHFTGLTSAEEIFLASNRLFEISSRFLETFKFLKTLDLSNNKLNGTMLSRLKGVANGREQENCNMSVENLILSGNPLMTVSEGDFQNLSIKEVLIMNSCKISDLVGSPFKNLSTLKELDLRNNSLVLIDVTTLEGLTSLVKLNLQNNKVSNWDRSIQIDTLESLNLQSNEIQSLHYFSILKLHDLHLSENNISVVEDEVVSKVLQGLKRFSLSANPFQCSCENEGLRSWLVNATERGILIDSLSDYRCHSPLSFKGVQLKSADICETKSNANTTTPVISTHVPDHSATSSIPIVEQLLSVWQIVTIVSIAIFLIMIFTIALCVKMFTKKNRDSPFRIKRKHTTDCAKRSEINICKIEGHGGPTAPVKDEQITYASGEDFLDVFDCDYIDFEDNMDYMNIYSDCSTSDTARALCIGPVQHDDREKNVILPVQVNGKLKEAIFNHNGGHLTLENYGISLFVPPGAIENGVSQAVSIEISYNKEHMPHFGEAVISPVVICRPKGLTFKEPVVLSYPHCGSSQHKIKHLISDTDHGEPVYYRDSSDDKDSISLVMGGMCLRIIDHFTLYASVAEGLVTKAFMIFADLRNKDGITLRIWIVNNTEDALKEVTNDHEFRKKGTELFGPKPYTIDSTSGDLQIEFKGVMDGWSTPNTVKIPLKRILEYAVDQEQIIISRKGCLSAKSDAVSMMVCAYQLQNSNAESVNMPIYIDVSQGSQAKLDKTLNDCSCTGTTEPLPAALPLGFCKRICLHMDSTELVANDWRTLAEEIGLSMPDIQLLESNKATKSPTGVLLNIWQSQRRGVKMEYFQELRDLFHKIERNDVVRYISKFIKVFEKDGLEAADQAIVPSSKSQMILAEIEHNDAKQYVMEAEGEDQSEENITQSRCQQHSNDNLSDDDDESPEEPTQIRTEKSCSQLKSKDSCPDERQALISSKDTSTEESASGLCGDNKVALKDSSLLGSDSGYISKSEVNGKES